MEAQVIPFSFESRAIRTLLIDDQPWFVAVDVCKALGITNTTQALQALDADERAMFNIGRQGEANIINESGLFTLILRSREATTPGTPHHRFRKWVTAEVLPAIRQHGRYEDSANQMATLAGQTIGTDGFRVLGSLIAGKVRALPSPTRRKATAKLWSQVHAAFNVRSAEDIPADQLDSVRNFIAAYALEGEYLEKQAGPDEVVLSPEQAADLFNLLGSSAWVEYRWKNGIEDGLRALKSPLADSTVDHIKDLGVSVRRLERVLMPALVVVVGKHYPVMLGARRPERCAMAAGDWRDSELL